MEKQNYVALRMNDNQCAALDAECARLGIDRSKLLRLASQWLCGFAPKEHRAEWRTFVRNATAAAL